MIQSYQRVGQWGHQTTRMLTFGYVTSRYVNTDRILSGSDQLLRRNAALKPWSSSMIRKLRSASAKLVSHRHSKRWKMQRRAKTMKLSSQVSIDSCVCWQFMSLLLKVWSQHSPSSIKAESPLLQCHPCLSVMFFCGRNWLPRSRLSMMWSTWWPAAVFADCRICRANDVETWAM